MSEKKYRPMTGGEEEQWRYEAEYWGDNSSDGRIAMGICGTIDILRDCIIELKAKLAFADEGTEKLETLIHALLARIAELEKERQAVIAKIQKDINDLDSHCCQGALFTILDFINNLEEAAKEVEDAERKADK